MDKSMRDEYDEEVAKNTRMKKEVNALQAAYLKEADKRLEAQRVLFSITDTVQKSDWRHKNKPKKTEKVVDAVFRMQEDVQGRARTIRDALEDQSDRDQRANAIESQEAMQDLSASSQLEDMLGKFMRQNKQLRRDLKNRQMYFDGEVKMTKDFWKTIREIVDLVKDKCADDPTLVQQVQAAAATPAT